MLIHPRSSSGDNVILISCLYRQARLSTFEEDIGLVGDDFNSAISVLTAGYMIGQIPSNMILTRIRPGLYLPACAFVWSCLSAATAGVTNKETLLVVRFFLGLAEAPFFPGAVFCMLIMRRSLWIKENTDLCV